MVSGADDFLDHISDNTSSVWVEMSVESLEGDCYELIKYQDLADGAMYYYIDELGYSREMWLCGVTEFVFGNMPNRIYCRKVLFSPKLFIHCNQIIQFNGKIKQGTHRSAIRTQGSQRAVQ